MPGVPALVLFGAAGYLAIGIVVFVLWRISHQDFWIEDFFRLPGALLLVWLAGIGLYYSLRVWRAFDTGEPMRRAWQLIALSAAADFSASLLVQIFGTQSRLNPLTYAAGGAFIASWRSAGLMIGGTCRFGMLSVGLLLVIMLYRRTGLLGRLAWVDWGLLLLFGAYIARETTDVVIRLQEGRKPLSGAEIFGLPVDPLLWVLLSQALRLYRSVKPMGLGWIGKCYAAFSVGILMVLLGDVAIWATNWGYLPWPWAALGWYAWIPAAAAFAVAPLFQWEAMRSAEVSRATGH
jgi:hypothetical protein